MKKYWLSATLAATSLIIGLFIGAGVALYFSMKLKTYAFQTRMLNTANWQVRVLSELHAGRTPQAETRLRMLAMNNLATLQSMRKNLPDKDRRALARLNERLDQLTRKQTIHQNPG